MDGAQSEARIICNFLTSNKSHCFYHTTPQYNKNQSQIASLSKFTRMVPQHSFSGSTPAMSHTSVTTDHTEKAASPIPSNTANKRRRNLLNKFLSKTFHMLSQCPQDIASWSDGGHSFTIKDVDAFEKDVIPQYFNHNKFPSFVRQLCFYGFSKQRSDPDLQTHTRAVRFSHIYFRQGQPELLHKITRTTASKPAITTATDVGEATAITTPPTATEIVRLTGEVHRLREHVAVLEERMEERIDETIHALEQHYIYRCRQLERSYEGLLLGVLPKHSSPISATSSTSRMLPSSIATLNPAMKLSQLSDMLRRQQQSKY